MRPLPGALRPERGGPFGILQPLADAVKAIFKEEIIPNHVDKVIYLMGPGISFAAVLITFAVIPFGPEVTLFGQQVGLWIGDVNVGLLFLLAIAGLGSYGVVLGGWSSNNKYSLLGALRAAAQMISYELPMGLALLSRGADCWQPEPEQIVEFQGGWPLIALQPVGFLLFLIAILAESNRSPFDLPETENELVSGFMTEYGGIKFALYFHRRVYGDGRQQRHRSHHLSGRMEVAGRHLGSAPVGRGGAVPGQGRSLSCSSLSGFGPACPACAMINSCVSAGSSWCRWPWSTWQ